jgi:hypothetical protein
MLRRLIPKEYDFFTSFEKGAAQAVVAAIAFYGIKYLR